MSVMKVCLGMIFPLNITDTGSGRISLSCGPIKAFLNTEVSGAAVQEG